MSEYLREKKEEKPVIAICYDFDKTLSPDDMQAQGYIQSVGYDVDDFWRESNSMAKNNDMDNNLAYMYLMKERAYGNIIFNKKALFEYGEKVSLYSGVEDWFKRILDYGEKQGVIVEHYIISSGLKEMIEGTSVAKSGVLKKIYACSFLYDDHGVAVWPAQVVNYTNKTQFLFRIEKGTLDVNDTGVNDYFRPEEIRVPFRNIVYIGDSDTDIPCMKLVNSYGGYSIGVFDPNKNDKSKVYKMMRENRIRFFAPADYAENSEIDKLVKAIIDRTALNERVEQYHNSAISEMLCNNDEQNKLRKIAKQNDLIISLENSGSFATTHATISELSKFTDWTSEQIEKLLSIAETNSQVRLILRDEDVHNFYRTIEKYNKS